MSDGANRLQAGKQLIASNLSTNNEEKDCRKLSTCVDRDDVTLANWQSNGSQTCNYDGNKENVAMEAMQTDSMSITTNFSFWSITEITKDRRQQRHAISNTSHRAKKQARMNRAN
jgi:hypothetical protein